MGQRSRMSPDVWRQSLGVDNRSDWFQASSSCIRCLIDENGQTRPLRTAFLD